MYRFWRAASCDVGCDVGCGAGWLPITFRGWRAGSCGVGCSEGCGVVGNNINGNGVLYG